MAKTPIPETPGEGRSVVFISKGTPEDDDFVLWLGPRLEAHGYGTFADILTLEPGDRWRKEITNTLQTRATKMLLCCRDATLAKQGVQEEIGIAEDLVKELSDPRFIIPLRLEKFKKLFGIGELQYVNFENRWAGGLIELLDALDKQNVQRDPDRIEINPNWENYKSRHAIRIDDAPERLTSNWLRVSQFPDTIRYFQPTGIINHQALHQECSESPYPAEPYMRGFFSFGTPDEIDGAFQRIGRFTVAAELPLMDFVEQGAESPPIAPREASNLVVSMFRQAWQKFCRDRQLYEYQWSQQASFHVTKAHLPIGKKIQWGAQGDARSSMLRNIAQSKVWQFGVTAIPAFWPFPHFKLKTRRTACPGPASAVPSSPNPPRQSPQQTESPFGASLNDFIDSIDPKTNSQTSPLKRLERIFFDLAARCRWKRVPDCPIIDALSTDSYSLLRRYVSGCHLLGAIFECGC